MKHQEVDDLPGGFAPFGEGFQPLAIDENWLEKVDFDASRLMLDISSHSCFPADEHGNEWDAIPVVVQGRVHTHDRGEPFLDGTWVRVSLRPDCEILVVEEDLADHGLDLLGHSGLTIRGDPIARLKRVREPPVPPRHKAPHLNVGNGRV